MQVERPYHLSAVEQELYFTGWAKNNGIKQFLFDFDDTICTTHQIFEAHTKQILDHLAFSYPQLTPEQWKNEYSQRYNQSFEKYGVNPNRFSLIANDLCGQFDLSKTTKKIIKSIFKNIYDTPVTFVEGAEGTLRFFKKIDLSFGIVTHANRSWTYKKYQWLGLERFLNWDDIFIVDENGHKTSESWQNAIDYFRVQPHDCAVIGNSPRSDINPATQIGVKHCFLVENSINWSVHQQETHQNVRRIKNLSQLIEIGSGQL